jgi:hypothetical protein
MACKASAETWTLTWTASLSLLAFGMAGSPVIKVVPISKDMETSGDIGAHHWATAAFLLLRPLLSILYFLSIGWGWVK